MKQSKGKKLMILFIAFIVLGATAVVTGANKQNPEFDFYGQFIGTDSIIKLSVIDSAFIRDSMVLIRQVEKGKSSLKLAQNSYVSSDEYDSSNVVSKDTLINLRVVRRK